MALLITLQDLLVRPASLDWFEAVAIVRAVCAEAVRLAHGASSTIPGRHGVLLTAEGSVEFVATAPSSGPPVVGAAALLQDLLSPDSAPAPLRSVISTALTSPARYASLEEFSQALEYFERPDRPRLLRGVFQRVEAAAAIDVLQPPVGTWGLDQFPSEEAALPIEGQEEFPSEGPDSSLPTLPSSAVDGPPEREKSGSASSPPPCSDTPDSLRTARDWPSPEDLPPTPAPPVAQWHRGPTPGLSQRSLALAVGAIAVVLLFAIGVAGGRAWQASRAVERPLLPPVPPVLLAAALPPVLSPIAGSWEVNGAGAVPARPGPAGIDGGTHVTGGTRVDRSRPPARASQGEPSSEANGSGEAAPVRTSVVATVAGREERTSEGPGTGAQDTGPEQPARTNVSPPPKSGVEASAGETRRVVYSPADVSVRPPVAVRTRYWTEPPPGVPVESLTRIEILVSERGEVESSRIVAGPRTYFDGQIVSAVKGWTFKPATLDGRPVAYRQQVWLSIAKW